jgi:hypothetical protein
MALDATRTLRGAAAGALAAGVWAAQQPLDIRVFGVPYDDAELLGSAITRERGTDRTTAVGTAMHLANGALFGALYSALPGRGPVKGLAAGMAEHLATWPSTRFVGRFHPVGRTFPQLWGDHRAFGQAVWRHALFGVLLGTLEARLNPPPEKPAPPAPSAGGLGGAETNGHAPVEAVIVTPAE